MLPIPELHLVNAPVIISMVLFTLLFVAVFWRKDKTSIIFGIHPNLRSIVFAIIMGMITNSILLGAITRADEPYYRGLFMFSLIPYNLLCSTIWLIGMDEVYRVLDHIKKSFYKTTDNLRLGSQALAIVVFVFSVAATSLYIQLLNPDMDGDYEKKYTILTNLEISSVLLRWLFLIFYAVRVYKFYRLIDRRSFDIFVAYGFLNCIPQLVDSIYIITKTTFPNPIGLTFIMFFFTDFLLVVNIAMIGLLWRMKTYDRIKLIKNEEDATTTTTTTTPTV